MTLEKSSYVNSGGRLKLAGVFLCLLVLASCSSLKVHESYYKVVKPGRKDLEPRVEFVFQLEKKIGKDLKVEEVVVHGYNGMDYHFKQFTLSNKDLNKSFSSVLDKEQFAVQVNSNQLSKKETSESVVTYAVIYYRLAPNEERKSIMVTDIKETEGRTLRRD